MSRFGTNSEPRFESGLYTRSTSMRLLASWSAFWVGLSRLRSANLGCSGGRDIRYGNVHSDLRTNLLMVGQRTNCSELLIRRFSSPDFDRRLNRTFPTATLGS